MEPFKSNISPDLIRIIAKLLERELHHHKLPGIDPHCFSERLISKLHDLELKERVNLIAEELNKALPRDFSKRANIILAMIHPNELEKWNSQSSEQGLCGWGVWPLTALIGTYGLGSTPRSLETLRQLTKRGTSEFDVRPFIEHDCAEATKIISSWADDDNLHVRRLVSEGTRPRLPWGIRLKSLIDNPKIMLPALTTLRDDPSDYVRRSVANHLNDMSKDHPEFIADLAKAWMEDASAERKKLIRHACRTLIKQGHRRTLAVFGFEKPQIAKLNVSIANENRKLGESLSFNVNLSSNSNRSQNLVIGHIIYLRKAKGLSIPKVFKWTKLHLKPNETRVLDRRHNFKEITTRRYYSGEHTICLRINGEDYGHEKFILEIGST